MPTQYLVRELAGLHRVDTLPDRVSDDGWVWIDVERPSRSEVDELAARYGWDRLTVEDVFDDTPLSKFADHGDHLFVVLHGLGSDHGTLEIIEVDAYLSEGVLVTIRHEALASFDDLAEAALRSPGLSEGGPDRMLARIAAALVEPFLRLIDAFELRLDELEDWAIGGDAAVVSEVQALRRDTTRLRRYVAPQRDVLAALMREAATELVGSRARHRFADVHEQVQRVVEALDGGRLLLGSVLETYRSTVTEETNRAMKVLTVFASIMLPLSVLAGIWGMNFEHMPELDEPWGYAAALGVMVFTALSLWTWFAWRGLIGRPRLRALPRAVGMGILQVATLPVRGLTAVVRGVLGEENRR